MSEDVQETQEQEQQPVEQQEQIEEQPTNVEATTESKKSTKGDKSANGKSQILIDSSLKAKLAGQKKDKESISDVIQKLWDSYKKKNNIVDDEISKFDEIKTLLLDTVDQLLPLYPINNNGAITYMENNNSLLYKLIGAVILEQSNEEVNKNLLKSIQQVVKAVNDLATTLSSIDISSVTKEMYWSSYNTYLNEIMNNKITLNNQVRQDYAQRINVLDSWNQVYGSVVNAIPKQS